GRAVRTGWIGLAALVAGCGDLLGFRDPSLRPPDRPYPCDDGWGYRVPVSLENASGKMLVDYKIPIVLDSWSLIDSGKLRADGGDLRFSDGAHRLPYHVERFLGTTATGIWVKAASIPPGQSTLWMLYGNPLAESESSVERTFVPGVLDNASFESDSDLPSWTRVEASSRLSRADAVWPARGWATDGAGSLHIYLE